MQPATRLSYIALACVPVSGQAEISFATLRAPSMAPLNMAATANAGSAAGRSTARYERPGNCAAQVRTWAWKSAKRWSSNGLRGDPLRDDLGAIWAKFRIGVQARSVTLE